MSFHTWVTGNEVSRSYTKPALGTWHMSSQPRKNQIPYHRQQGHAYQTSVISSLVRWSVAKLPPPLASHMQTTPPFLPHSLPFLGFLFYWWATESLAPQSDLTLNWEIVSGNSWESPAGVWHPGFSMWEFDSICDGMSFNQTHHEHKTGICGGAQLSSPRTSVSLPIFTVVSLFLIIIYSALGTRHLLFTISN